MAQQQKDLLTRLADAGEDAIQRLAKELLEQEATGDRARAEAWFKKYGTMPPALKQALEAARDVPIDVDPIVSFDEAVK